MGGGDKEGDAGGESELVRLDETERRLVRAGVRVGGMKNLAETEIRTRLGPRTIRSAVKMQVECLASRLSGRGPPDRPAQD